GGGLLAVRARPRVARPDLAAHGGADAPARRRQQPRRGVHGPVGFADQWAERTAAWPPFGDRQQRVERTRVPFEVGVGDDDPADVVAELGHATVGRGPVAEVVAHRHEPDVGTFGRLLRGTYYRPVVVEV